VMDECLLHTRAEVGGCPLVCVRCVPCGHYMHVVKLPDPGSADTPSQRPPPPPHHPLTHTHHPPPT
jgi:hypothetical protein